MPYRVFKLSAGSGAGVDADAVASPVAVNQGPRLVVAGHVIRPQGLQAVVWRLQGRSGWVPRAIPDGPFVPGTLMVRGLSDDDGHAREGVVVGHGLLPSGELRPFVYRLRVGRTQANGRVVWSDVGPTLLNTRLRGPSDDDGNRPSLGHAQALAVAGSGTGLPFIAGQSDVEGGAQRACTWWGSADPQSLPTLGGSTSWATAVSSSGDVAGWSELPGGQAHAVYFTRLGASVPQMRDLGTLGGTTSAVMAAASGLGPDATVHLVGQADDGSGVNRACRFFFGPDRAWLIPGADAGPGAACAVNRHGVAVGHLTQRGRTRAFVHRPGATRLAWLDRELAPPLADKDALEGLALHEARAVGNGGDIVAVGRLGERVAGFLLRPL